MSQIIGKLKGSVLFMWAMSAFHCVQCQGVDATRLFVLVTLARDSDNHWANRKHVEREN
jgi:hypothetical protein